MKSHFKLLSCLLLLPVAVATNAAPQNLHGKQWSPPTYQTQPGTHELPPRYQAPNGPNAKLRLAYWNEAALRANAVDSTPPYPGGGTASTEQGGPTRTSRALAIVQIAVFDALNAIYKRYPGYSGNLVAFADSSPDAAIAQSAHDTLVALYPSQKDRFDRWLKDDLARLPSGRSKNDGIDIGHRAAAAILALRARDGSYEGEPVVGEDYHVGHKPGDWRPDPISQIPIALGAYWGETNPFVLVSSEQFPIPQRPAMSSDAYARAFNEVKAVGGDGIKTSTKRTKEQTAAGLYWAYDGAAWLGTPPRLYNQIAVQIALQRAKDALELARALALVNAAIADSCMSVWYYKYEYDFWRPVTAVREASPGTGPTGLGDFNSATQADPNWVPLGAPASNLTGPNFTPPFPSYPSSHAGLGSAMFEMLRRLYGDNVSFTFVSDELNGITHDANGKVRPLSPRSYKTLTQAENENGQSRIYLGIHFQFDRQEGMSLGRRVADYIYERGLVRSTGHQ